MPLDTLSLKKLGNIYIRRLEEITRPLMAFQDNDGRISGPIQRCIPYLRGLESVQWVQATQLWSHLDRVTLVI
jgi:hypothetical protein